GVDRGGAEWRRTVDAAGPGLLLLDGDDRVTRSNRSARERADGADVAGRALADLGPREPWASAAAAVRAARRTGASESATARDPVLGLVCALTASLMPEPRAER